MPRHHNTSKAPEVLHQGIPASTLIGLSVLDTTMPPSQPNTNNDPSSPMVSLAYSLKKKLASRRSRIGSDALNNCSFAESLKHTQLSMKSSTTQRSRPLMTLTRPSNARYLQPKSNYVTCNIWSIPRRPNSMTWYRNMMPNWWNTPHRHRQISTRPSKICSRFLTLVLLIRLQPSTTTYNLYNLSTKLQQLPNPVCHPPNSSHNSTHYQQCATTPSRSTHSKG